MPTLAIEYRDDAERLAFEQARAYFTQLRQVAASAPEGTVLAACEERAVRQGRALLRTTLAAAVQARIAAAEQKGGAPAPAPARTLPATKDNTPAPS